MHAPLIDLLIDNGSIAAIEPAGTTASPTSPPLISKRTTSGRRSSTCTRGRRHLGLAGLSLPGSQIRVAELVQSGCDLDLQPHIGGRSLACDQPGEPALSPFLLSLIHHRHGQERPRVLTVVLFPAPRRGGSRKVRVDFQAGPRVRRLVWGFSCQAVVSGCADGFLFGAGKAVFRPVACDQVRGARGRGQGTETVAKLGGLPLSDACVSQRLDA